MFIDIGFKRITCTRIIGLLPLPPQLKPEPPEFLIGIPKLFFRYEHEAPVECEGPICAFLIYRVIIKSEFLELTKPLDGEQKMEQVVRSEGFGLVAC